MAPRSLRSSPLGALAGAALLLSTSACATPVEPLEGEGDAIDASFGGADAKADGRFGECELREVLLLLNASTTSAESLRTTALAGLRTKDVVARNVIAHRDGADATLGTADDDLFDSLDELDSVDFVGPAALGALAGSVADRCTLDLSTRPFIDDTTFASTTGGGWTRENVEHEAVMTVTGITGASLHAILTKRDARGRTVFERMRRNRLMEAFSYDYGPDEMPWDGDSHAARESMPYVALTIEWGRFEPDATSGMRELSLGTDVMDDTYFDTRSFALLHHGMLLRGRARWDDPRTVRRLLIGAKFGNELDAEGNKRPGKIDVRNDGASPEEVASLEADVMRGVVGWSGSTTPVEPVRAIYETLRAENLLQDLGGRRAVLLLEPMAHLRSVRSRYHLEEASIEAVRRLHDTGNERIRASVERARALLEAGTLTDANEVALLRAFVTLGGGIVDRTIVLERANAALTGAALAPYTAADLPMPSSFGNATSADELERHRHVAEAFSALCHELAESLDDVDRILTDTRDRDGEESVDWYVAWQRTVERSLAPKTVVDPFLARWRAVAEADVEAQRAAFNAFGEAQRAANADGFDDFEALDRAAWDALGRHLDHAVLEIAGRQIEAAGTMARTLWFDEARRLFVPSSYRATSNFIIDTMDFTQMLSHQEWIGIPEAERTLERPLPPERILHTTLVNEAQIELGSETAYQQRIAALEAEIAGGMARPEAMRELEGARFVFDQYLGALRRVTELKGERVIRTLRREGAPSEIAWVPATHAKGEAALLRIADED